MTEIPHPLDHLVLPVSDLAEARGRLTRLGFTVAPDGIHPFGTANCCVFFADGTFLEPLAVADRAIADAAASAGNVFVRHDRDHRARNGEEGFSAVVFATGDATRDHARFVGSGISAGELLDFSREFATLEGGRDQAAFRLAFALGPDAPDCLFFTCERVRAPDVDRTPLQRHANGVTGVAGVLMTAPDPQHLAGTLQQTAGAPPQPDGDGMVLRRGVFVLRVMTMDHFADETGLPDDGDGRTAFRALELACQDMADLRRRLAAASIGFHEAPAGLVVPPAPGQGAALIFRSPAAG